MEGGSPKGFDSCVGWKQITLSFCFPLDGISILFVVEWIFMGALDVDAEKQLF